MGDVVIQGRETGGRLVMYRAQGVAGDPRAG